MSYPPVPYPSISPVADVSQDEQTRAKDSSSSTQTSLASSATARSTSQIPSSPSKLSQPFKSPRLKPLATPFVPPPRESFYTRGEKAFEKLLRTKTRESPDREFGKVNEREREFPGVFNSYKTPEKVQLDGKKRQIEEIDSGKEGIANEKGKRSKVSHSEKGEAEQNIDREASVLGSDDVEPAASQSTSSSTSPPTSPMNRHYSAPRTPFRSPHPVDQERRNETLAQSKTLEDDDDEDELLEALNRIIEGKFMTRDGETRKLRDRIACRKQQEKEKSLGVSGK